MEATGRAELVSGLTHLAGAILSVVGLAVLVILASLETTPWHVVGFAVFGASLILLYVASSLYHLLPIRPARREALRRVDHMMIYILIAGTYTPVCLTVLRGPWGWSILGLIWTLAIAGILFKRFWFGAPRWLSTVLYIVMGWVALAALVPLVEAIGWEGIGWLLAGGVLYTVGATIYAVRWPTLSARHFTFHELFHIWVLAGSLSHFWLMLAYILPAGS